KPQTTVQNGQSPDANGKETTLQGEASKSSHHDLLKKIGSGMGKALEAGAAVAVPLGGEYMMMKMMNNNNGMYSSPYGASPYGTSPYGYGYPSGYGYPTGGYPMGGYPMGGYPMGYPMSGYSYGTPMMGMPTTTGSSSFLGGLG